MFALRWESNSDADCDLRAGMNAKSQGGSVEGPGDTEVARAKQWKYWKRQGVSWEDARVMQVWSGRRRMLRKVTPAVAVRGRWE